MKPVKDFWMFFLWFGVILYLSFTPLSGWPQPGIFEKLYIDKVIHVSMYAILNFLLTRALLRQQRVTGFRYTAIVLSITFCVAAGVLIEFLQPALTRYRHFEWLDAVANSAGSVVGYAFYGLVIKKRAWGHRR